MGEDWRTWRPPDQDFLIDMDKVGAALFHAFGAAKNGGLPAAPTSDGDWSLLVDAFISRNSSKLKKPTGPLPQS